MYQQDIMAGPCKGCTPAHSARVSVLTSPEPVQDNNKGWNTDKAGRKRECGRLAPFATIVTHP